MRATRSRLCGRSIVRVFERDSSFRAFGWLIAYLFSLSILLSTHAGAADRGIEKSTVPETKTALEKLLSAVASQQAGVATGGAVYDRTRLLVTLTNSAHVERALPSIKCTVDDEQRCRDELQEVLNTTMAGVSKDLGLVRSAVILGKVTLGETKDSEVGVPILVNAPLPADKSRVTLGCDTPTVIEIQLQAPTPKEGSKKITSNGRGGVSWWISPNCTLNVEFPSVFSMFQSADFFPDDPYLRESCAWGFGPERDFESNPALTGGTRAFEWWRRCRTSPKCQAFWATSLPPNQTAVSQTQDAVASARSSQSLVAIIDSPIASSTEVVVSRSASCVLKNASKNESNADSGCIEESSADSHFHGTMIAQIIGASQNNAIGVSGVTPATQIYSIAVTDGTTPFTSIEVARAIKHVADFNASQRDATSIPQASGTENRPQIIRVVVLALGTETYSEGLRKVMESVGKEVLFVIAAGNRLAGGRSLDTSYKVYPASFGLPNSIVIGAIDSSGGLWGSSNFGRKSVHLAAPGVGVCAGSDRNSALVTASGTSFGTAFAAGAAALAARICPNHDAQQNKRLVLQWTRRLSSLDGKIQDARALDLGKVANDWPVDTMCEKKK